MVRRRWFIALLLAGIASLTAGTLSGVANPDPRSEFYATWARSDGPVTAGLTQRTWIWGPGPYTQWMIEPYADAPDGERDVQYFPKTRMEINDPEADRASDWFVTNGLLARELITGRVQLGDNVFEQRPAASVQIAGDQHPDSPTYAGLHPLMEWNATPAGWTLIQQLHSDGAVTGNDALAAFDVTSAYVVEETGHSVASVFWEFMTSTGVVFKDGEYPQGPIFGNPFVATGLPITEAYWVYVPVGGVWQFVLVQCFERRCLTYTPGNPSGWQVEAGNIGQHYYLWRYGEPAPGSPSAFPAPVPDGASSPADGCVNLNIASFNELRRIIHIDGVRAQHVIDLRPFHSVDDLIDVPGIGPARLADITQQGLACV